MVDWLRHIKGRCGIRNIRSGHPSLVRYPSGHSRIPHPQPRGILLLAAAGFRSSPVTLTSGGVRWVLTSGGLLLILIALRDIFDTLWRPSGFGTLARLIFRWIWKASKLRKGSGTGRSAGPLGVLFTLGAWSALVVTGFAMIYLPRLSEDFVFTSGLQPGSSSELVTAFYVSTVALTTLGVGDIAPSSSLLRVFMPVEALLGFVLLTAGISWILQLYSALNRRRALARNLTTMRRMQAERLVQTGEASVAIQLLEAVRKDTAATEMDLLQYAESYYFRDGRTDISLAAALPYVAELVRSGERSGSEEVRLAAAMLGDGLAEVLRLLREQYLDRVGDADDTLRAFATDHGGTGSA